MENASQPPLPQIGGLGGEITGVLKKYPVILQLLRFGAIGVLNTALDFLILNLTSKSLGISSGLRLGQINVIGFALATVQSYFWNRSWAFSAEQGLTLLKNFIRLVLVGLLGFLAMVLVLIGAKISAQAVFYFILLVVYILAEAALWKSFGLGKPEGGNSGRQFAVFLAVSVVGLLINSALVWLITSNFALVDNADLNKNAAKIVATGASLVWNFVGYKIFVFKK